MRRAAEADREGADAHAHTRVKTKFFGNVGYQRFNILRVVPAENPDHSRRCDFFGPGVAQHFRGDEQRLLVGQLGAVVSRRPDEFIWLRCKNLVHA